DVAAFAVENVANGASVGEDRAPANFVSRLQDGGRQLRLEFSNKFSSVFGSLAFEAPYFFESPCKCGIIKAANLTGVERCHIRARNALGRHFIQQRAGKGTARDQCFDNGATFLRLELPIAPGKPLPDGRVIERSQTANGDSAEIVNAHELFANRAQVGRATGD